MHRIDLSFDPATAKAISDAERSVSAFYPEHGDELGIRAFCDMCANVELFANAKHAGNQPAVRRFFQDGISGPSSDSQGALNVIEALDRANELGCGRITAATFREINRCLLANTTRDPHKGEMRAGSMQVGGSRNLAFGEERRLPDASKISAHLADLASFMNNEDVPAVVQASLAHAQIAAVHPFARGVGKTALAMTQLAFAHRGLLAGPVVFPISLAYGVTTSSFTSGSAKISAALLSEQPSVDTIRAWVRYHAQCCMQTAEEIGKLAARFTILQQGWKDELGMRSDSAALLITQALPAQPLFTAKWMSSYIGRSFKRTSVSIDEMVEAGILRLATTGKRNRVFECPQVLDAYRSIPGFQ